MAITISNGFYMDRGYSSAESQRVAREQAIRKRSEEVKSLLPIDLITACNNFDAEFLNFKHVEIIESYGIDEYVKSFNALKVFFNSDLNRHIQISMVEAEYLHICIDKIRAAAVAWVLIGTDK